MSVLERRNSSKRKSENNGRNSFDSFILFSPELIPPEILGMKKRGHN